MDAYEAVGPARHAEYERLAQAIATCTVDLALPQDPEPRWGHLSLSSSLTMAMFVLGWLHNDGGGA